MIRSRINMVDILLLAAAAGLCIGAFRRSEEIFLPSPVSHVRPRLSVAVAPYQPDSVEARVLDRDVFGALKPDTLSRGIQRPSPTATIPIPQGVFLTNLSIKAIAGPPWVAVLSGFPGSATQAVVITGDTVGHYRIRSISSDSVTLQTPDSIIRLSFIRIGS